MIDSAPVARLLREYLANPANAGALRQVFGFSLRRASSYLGALRRRGRPLPLDEFAGENPLHDLAARCLENLFSPPRLGEPLEIVRALDPYRTVADDELVNRFETVLRRHIKQGLDHVAQERDHEGHNLKRALRRALNSASGEFALVPVNGTEEWCWTRAQSAIRTERMAVEAQTLRRWACEAWNEHRPVPDLCRFIFARLDDTDRYRNSLSFSALLVALKEEDSVSLDDMTASSDSPEMAFELSCLRAAVRSARQATIDADFERLAITAALAPTEREGVLQALTVLAEDWAEHGSCDSRRVYMEEVLGPIEDEVYLKKFHYLWNTLVANMEGRIRGMLSDGGGPGS